MSYSSVLCLLQLQHPLSPGQVVHLLKRLYLGEENSDWVLEQSCSSGDWEEEMLHVHMGMAVMRGHLEDGGAVMKEDAWTQTGWLPDRLLSSSY